MNPIVRIENQIYKKTVNNRLTVYIYKFEHIFKDNLSTSTVNNQNTDLIEYVRSLEQRLADTERLLSSLTRRVDYNDNRRLKQHDLKGEDY